jgi:hypothetical protein
MKVPRDFEDDQPDHEDLQQTFMKYLPRSSSVSRTLEEWLELCPPEGLAKPGR